MKERKILYAKEGKLLTNGKIFGKVIYLARSLKESDFYEIEEDEYEKRFEVEEIS